MRQSSPSFGLSSLAATFVAVRERLKLYGRYPDLWEFYDYIRVILCAVRPLQAIYICRYHSDTAKLFYAYLAEAERIDWSSFKRTQGREWSLGNGPTSWTITNKLPLARSAGVPSVAGPGTPFLSTHLNRNSLHLPILAASGVVLGAIGVFADEEEPFDDFWIASFSLVANWTASTLVSRGEAGVARFRDVPVGRRGKEFDLSALELKILVSIASGGVAKNIAKAEGISVPAFYRWKASGLAKLGLSNVEYPDVFLRDALRAQNLPLTLAELD